MVLTEEGEKKESAWLELGVLLANDNRGLVRLSDRGISKSARAPPVFIRSSDVGRHLFDMLQSTCRIGPNAASHRYNSLV